MTRLIVVLALSIIVFSCNEKKKEPLFLLKTAEETGITFQNTLKPDGELNIFRYMYFYNGGGIGAGDFNNDGLIDLFFSANQGQNELYINTSEITFKNTTKASNIKSNKGWNTGVSVVDINQDGMLDIYVSQVGDFETLKGHNLLYICQEITEEGIPVYEEKAKEYQLDLVGFGTQAAFFDYDLDGDLDFFQLNHSVHQNGTFGKRDYFIKQVHPLAGDRFFENVDGKYIEKSQDSQIYRNALGYGLGLKVADINLDGYPDLYIGNDFHENDYLYINQKNKTFTDELGKRLNHTSRFSMGVDIADLNNDAHPEIVSLDMLPYDNEILKRSEGEDAFYNFEFKLKQGYNYQFARNNLQLNLGDGTFSEIGMFAGVHATDWSWSSLFLDFDNDGKKDLFISNGINKRMNDTDYINFVSGSEIQQKIAEKRFDESDESLIDLIPEIKIPNSFFLNKGDLEFTNISEEINGNKASFSNGAVYVDLDNDGDLEIVCNNINDEAFIFENKTSSLHKDRTALKVKLKGSSQNLNAVGTKILAFSTGGGLQYFEKYPVQGFQSSVESDLLIPSTKKIDSVWVVWPDNRYTTLTEELDSNSITVTYSDQNHIFDYSLLEKKKKPSIQDVTANTFSSTVLHEENDFIEFDREALIPFKMSTEGPALAVGDLNGDGLEDFFLGSSRKFKSHIYLQNSKGRFSELNASAVKNDSLYEDVDALIFDANNDGLNDLFVLSGGNEYLNKSPFNSGRLYLNSVSGGLQRSTFPETYTTLDCIAATDVDSDGDIDLFLGSRTKPWNYGIKPNSFLFINDGKGHFENSNQEALANLGMVKDARWVDIDNDEDEDLFVAVEWGDLLVLKNENGLLQKPIALTGRSGWWNSMYPIDLDNDGDTDFVIGNHGENSRMQTKEDQVIRMYVNDFDENGRLDQIITYYVNGVETIFADKKEIEKQLPYIRKKYIKSKDFAEASIADIFGKEALASSEIYKANFLKNAVLWNNGEEKFTLEALPSEFQYAPYYSIIEMNKQQLLMGGNFYDANIQLGRYDADKGTILNYDGQKFSKDLLGLEGQIRVIKSIDIQGEPHYLIARNDDELRVFKKTSE